METGKLIKALRKSRGISAEQLAEVIGVAPSTIYRYENGDIHFRHKKSGADVCLLLP